MADQTLQLPREGEKLGSGILLSLINTGGSAYVYKTWCESLEIHRAVKVMSPDAEPDVRDRFQTEGRINSKLMHPHIVQCFNFGITVGGLPYLEMEYLSGPSLSAIVQKRGALPLQVSLAIAFGVLEALSYAHTIKYTLYDKQHVGLVHRDLKPSNVVIAADGNVKLMDFGIARPVDTSLHTVAGTVPGTVAYMSPEACSGGDIDFRSDIYQIGLVLYELLSGQTVFPQPDLTSLLEAKGSNKFQPIESVVKGIDRRIVPVLRKCLQLDPAQRYRSAHECLVEVRALYDALCPGNRPNLLILSYLDGTPLPAAVRRFNLPLVAKVAAVVCAGIFLTILLGLSIYRYGPWLLSSAKNLSSSMPSPGPIAQGSPQIIPAAPQTAPAAAISQPPASALPLMAPRVKKAAAALQTQNLPISKPDTAQPMPVSPEDAMFFVLQGKTQYNTGHLNEALSSYQTALRMPSQKPRQEIVKSCVYGSARCNAALYKQGRIPESNYVASWRSVLNTFPDASQEHSEALSRLQEVAE